MDMASKHAAVLVSGAPDLIVLLIFRGIGKLQLRQKYHLDIGRLSVNNTIDAALELKEFEYISPESPRGRYIYLATDGLFFLKQNVQPSSTTLLFRRLGRENGPWTLIYPSSGFSKTENTQCEKGATSKEGEKILRSLPKNS